MTSYAESLLTPDERVLRRERQHPIALLLDSWLAIVLWAAAIGLIVVRFLLPDEIVGRDLFGSSTWFGTAGLAVTWLTLLGGILVLALRWWWWRTRCGVRRTPKPSCCTPSRSGCTGATGRIWRTW